MSAGANYARAALDAECAILASTGRGRNDQANRSGFAMGQFIPGGHLDRSEVEHRLMSAAEASGIVKKDGAAAVRATLCSGIEGGMRQPRAAPNGNGFTMEDIEILRRKPKLSDVPIPQWTVPGENGRPKLSFIGKTEPIVFDDEVRRHRYERNGEPVRFKIKKADGSFTTWYRVRRPSDSAIGWQARKPAEWVDVPYVPPGARNPFDAERRGEIVVWAEGEKDADTAVARGFLAFTFGSASDVPDVSELLEGHHVVVVVDHDEAGRKSISRKIEALISAKAASIKLVQFPELPDGGDLSDFFDGGATAEDLLDRAERIDPATWNPEPKAEDGGDKGAKASRRKTTTAPPRGANDDRPVIAIRAGAIKAAVDATEAALIAKGGLFQRANQVVFMGETPVVTHDKREVTASRIFERGESALAEDIVEAACIMKWDARAEEDVVIDAPVRLVKTLKDRIGRFRFPILTAIVNAPTLRPDGSLLSAPGYDRRTGLFLDPRGVEFPPILERPSLADAERALEIFSDLLSGFPFEDKASRAVALSAILTACVRQAVVTAPLHGFSAPVAGSGKSKLVDIASVISTGREAGVTAQTADEIEMEKRLGALYLQGAGMVAIDNCTFPIDGNFLCAALTQSSVSIRPLGTSNYIEVPTTTFLTATGNNLVIAGDMTRRAIVARLDPRVERPELRQFDFEPVAKAKAERVRYITAALTIMLAYKAAGAPKRANPLGSFEGWSRLVRDALMWVGCADPVTTMDAARELDPKLHELAEVLAQWKVTVGTDPITVRRLIDRASRQSAGEGFSFAKSEFDFPDLREALLAVAGQGGAINGRRLGKWLGAHAKRIVGGCWIEADGIYDGAAMWRLREQKTPRSTEPARSYGDRDPLH